VNDEAPAENHARRNARNGHSRPADLYCSDYKCSHNVAMSADQWPDDVRLSDLEPLFVCQACGLKGAEVRADFNWASKQNKTRRV
jgi:hypothetical protein